MDGTIVQVEILAPVSILSATSADAFLGSFSQVVRRLSSKYVWQRQALLFSNSEDEGLLFPHAPTRIEKTHLTVSWNTSVDVGLNISDEFFILHLLRRLSLEHPNFTVHVWDSDGEFLIVEASDVIPDSMHAELDERRGVIRGGKFFLAGTDLGRDKWVQTPVERRADDVLASTTKQHISESRRTYRTWALLPKRLGVLFRRHPWVLAAASEAAFHDSNPLMSSLLEKKLAEEEHRGKRSTGKSSDSEGPLAIFKKGKFENVMVTVQLTKFQYCQLLQTPDSARKDWSRRRKATRVGELLFGGFQIFRHLLASGVRKEKIRSLLLSGDGDGDGGGICEEVEDVVEWPRPGAPGESGFAEEISGDLLGRVEEWMFQTSGVEGVEVEEEGEESEVAPGRDDAGMEGGEFDRETQRVMKEMDDELGSVGQQRGGYPDDEFFKAMFRQQSTGPDEGNPLRSFMQALESFAGGAEAYTSPE